MRFGFCRSTISHSRRPAAHNLRRPAAHNLRRPAAHNLRRPAAHNLRRPAAHNLRRPAACPRDPFLKNPSPTLAQRVAGEGQGRGGKYTALCATLFFLLATSTVFASAATDLTSTLASFSSLQADFDQRVFDQDNQLIQHSRGRLALSRPGRLRWELFSPNPQVLLVNQKKVSIYDPDLAQMTVRALQSEDVTQPGYLLTGSLNEAMQQYVVSVAPSKTAYEQCFRLRPNNTEASKLRGLVLCFQKNILARMVMQDALSQRTEIVFHAVKNNAPMPKQTFELLVPKDVDIVNM